MLYEEIDGTLKSETNRTRIIILLSSKARLSSKTQTGRVPLSTAGCHRPDGDCHHDDVGRDGVHRGCEADDDDRHQPDHEAAARPIISVEHDALLI